MARKEPVDYPPDIWLLGATRQDILRGTPVKEAYAKAVAFYQEQGRRERQHKAERQKAEATNGR